MARDSSPELASGRLPSLRLVAAALASSATFVIALGLVAFWTRDAGLPSGPATGPSQTRPTAAGEADESVAVPSGEPAIGTPAGASPWDAQTLRAAKEILADAVRACVRGSRAWDPAIADRFAVRVSVRCAAGQGRFTDVATTPESPHLVACLVRALPTLQFPAGSSGTRRWVLEVGADDARWRGRAGDWP